MEDKAKIKNLIEDGPMRENFISPHSEDFIGWAADAYLTKFSDLTKLKIVVRSLLENGKMKEPEKFKDVSM